MFTLPSLHLSSFLVEKKGHYQWKSYLLEALECARNANADDGHTKRTTKIQGEEKKSGVMSSKSTLEPLQLRFAEDA